VTGKNTGCYVPETSQIWLSWRFSFFPLSQLYTVAPSDLSCWRCSGYSAVRI